MDTEQKPDLEELRRGLDGIRHALHVGALAMCHHNHIQIGSYMFQAADKLDSAIQQIDWEKRNETQTSSNQ
jgi:hypothetical protein